MAASFVGPKRTVAVGLAALAVAIGYGRAVGVDLLAGAQALVVAIGVATVLSGWWRGSGWSGKGGCGAVTWVAEVAQRALLGGAPGVGEPAPGCAVRLGQRRGVDRGTSTRHWRPRTVRLLVGDVRQGPGRGPAGRGGAGSFRDAAQDRPGLAEVAAALDRSVTRAIGLEDFVTAAAVQVLGDGSAIVVNCGHPASLLVRGGRATELDPPGAGAAAGPGACALSRCGCGWRWATGSCCTPMG